MTIHIVEQTNSDLLLTDTARDLSICSSHFEPIYLEKQKLITNTAKGRGIVYFFRLMDTNLVLRHYQRGGLVAKMSKDKFAYTGIKNSRCYRELSVLQTLRKAKVNVPEPIAGQIKKQGPIYSADLITKVIDGAVELDELLQNELQPQCLWEKIGAEIRKMHNAQVCHYDLNVKNILLTRLNDKSKVHLLDFDKCDLKQGNSWKGANLARLERSLLKQSRLQPCYHYHQANWRSLMAGYEQ